MPLGWIDYRDAVRLYHGGQVAFTCGSTLFTLRGGINARTGRRSLLRVHSIIATRGEHRSLHKRHRPPPLDNRALFKRDAWICLYCARRFPEHELSRDHVTPLSQGGQDTWNNVVTACKRCNHRKAGRRPEEAGMELIAVPFTPTHAEYLYLKGRRILADQMAFLAAHFPRHSPLRGRSADH
ncbi:MAG: HNH endonuclease [Gammaproteobacteria bacterium]|nr:MAG: HNH endonuclease [Gammaproteobacteria bacterium]